MLELLHIENIAIIEEAEIAFRPGFNALTGETGAGKSIVIDAMSAVLGQRTSRDLIRTGASKAFVSALFSHVDPALCEELGAVPDENGDLMLQREIGADGKNVCRVGGRPVTVSQLRTLGSRLVNIHGQHDGQQLLDEEQHLAYLDSFGKVDSLLEAYTDKYNSLTDIRRKMNALQMDEAEKARRMDTLQYQIGELERAKLKSGEEEELQSRRNLLRNAEKFISAVSGADYALNGGEDGSGVLNLLRRPQLSYADLRPFDPAPQTLAADVVEQVEITVKYEGYIRRQMAEVEEFARLESRLLPEELDYSGIDGLRLEAREKLAAIRPRSLGQAGRISGVSPADLAALMIFLEKEKRHENS